MVEVATPDHWHALPLIDAVKAGLDVHVQKPTGVDVVESRDAGCRRKYGRTVQVGTQRRSTPHLIEPVTESLGKAYSVKSPMLISVATTTCGQDKILRSVSRLPILIMTDGPAPPPIHLAWSPSFLASHGAQQRDHG